MDKPAVDSAEWQAACTEELARQLDDTVEQNDTLDSNLPSPLPADTDNATTHTNPERSANILQAQLGPKTQRTDVIVID